MKIEDLPEDIRLLVLAHALNETPVPRQVCSEWKCLSDELIRRVDRDDICRLFSAMRLRVPHVPMRWFLRYRYRSCNETALPWYNCAMCGKRVKALGECRECSLRMLQAYLHYFEPPPEPPPDRFPTIRALGGPLLAASFVALFYFF